MQKSALALQILLSLCCLGLLGRHSPASDWPRFRGPNGTGTATGAAIPVRWTEQDVLWKTELPGSGNSSVIVWGEKLFVQSASKDGKDRLLLCLSVRDGHLLWSQTVPGSPARMHAKNTLASSTPATDGERVYAVFWDGHNVALHAYDFKGNPVWKQELGAFTSQHGAGTSPMVYRDKVYLANDQDGTAELLAFDAKSGKPAWSMPRRPYRACYSTPLILENGSEAELIVVSTGGITSYKPDTGSENWNFNWPPGSKPLRTVASPVFGQGLVFANSGDGDGSRHTVAVKASGSGDISKTNLAWEEKKAFPYVPTMLVSGRYLFYVNDHGIAACHVAATGAPVWSQRLGGSVYASPILVDGKIYAVTENGTVFVFDAGSAYKELARNSIGEPVLATPAVAGNRLIIRGTEHLFCIGKAGEKQTSAP